MESMADLLRSVQERMRRNQAQMASLVVWGPRPLAIGDHDGRTVHLVSREPSDPSQWRVTRFDDRGAAGDCRRATFRQVLVAALDYGADLATAVAVAPDTASDAAACLGVVIGYEETTEDRAYLDRLAADPRA